MLDIKHPGYLEALRMMGLIDIIVDMDDTVSYVISNVVINTEYKTPGISGGPEDDGPHRYHGLYGWLSKLFFLQYFSYVKSSLVS